MDKKANIYGLNSGEAPETLDACVGEEGLEPNASDKTGGMRDIEIDDGCAPVSPDGPKSGRIEGSFRVFKEIVRASSEVKTNEEVAALLCIVGHTSGLTESGIAAEVLKSLLPDDGVVVLPRVSRVSGGWPYRCVKRAFDLVACAAALVILAVPMAVIAFKIRRESPGSAIYAQRRVGKDGRIFRLYKFRSMYIDAEVSGARWASGDDPRVTPFGRFLRKTRLDEIPQFWNVVKGDMSLIGPRPERPAFHEEFCKRIDGWNQRLLVRPGITGLAQVTGGYDLLPREKVLYDIEYIENRGCAMDASIILKTVKTMISGEGAR